VTKSVIQARQTIERRINELGVAEPSIAQQGADQILVQLPGVTDIDRAKSIIGSPGLLELKIVEGRAVAVQGSADGQRPGAAGHGDRAGRRQRGRHHDGLLHGEEGRRRHRPGSAERARVVDENNRPAVSFTLSNEGGRKFGKVSGENIGRQLAIILDGRVQSAPTLESNQFRRAHHRQLHARRGAGSLAQAAVGRAAGQAGLPGGADDRPTLGADSIRSGVTASVVGLLLVTVFMLIYYKLSGVNAVVALVFNLVILLG
jgi:Preprotein translocase subunit SecD